MKTALFITPILPSWPPKDRKFIEEDASCAIVRRLLRDSDFGRSITRTLTKIHGIDLDAALASNRTGKNVSHNHLVSFSVAKVMARRIIDHGHTILAAGYSAGMLALASASGAVDVQDYEQYWEPVFGVKSARTARARSDIVSNRFRCTCLYNDTRSTFLAELREIIEVQFSEQIEIVDSRSPHGAMLVGYSGAIEALYARLVQQDPATALYSKAPSLYGTAHTTRFRHHSDVEEAILTAPVRRPLVPLCSATGRVTTEDVSFDDLRKVLSGAMLCPIDMGRVAEEISLRVDRVMVVGPSFMARFCFFGTALDSQKLEYVNAQSLERADAHGTPIRIYDGRPWTMDE